MNFLTLIYGVVPFFCVERQTIEPFDTKRHMSTGSDKTSVWKRRVKRRKTGKLADAPGAFGALTVSHKTA